MATNSKKNTTAAIENLDFEELRNVIEQRFTDLQEREQQLASELAEVRSKLSDARRMLKGKSSGSSTRPSPKRDAVLAAISDSTSVSDIMAATEQSRQNVTNHLNSLLELGQVKRVSRGHYSRTDAGEVEAEATQAEQAPEADQAA